MEPGLYFRSFVSVVDCSRFGGLIMVPIYMKDTMLCLSSNPIQLIDMLLTAKFSGILVDLAPPFMNRFGSSELARFIAW